MSDVTTGIFLGLGFFVTWHLYSIADNVRAIRGRLDEAARKERASH